MFSQEEIGLDIISVKVELKKRDINKRTFKKSFYKSLHKNSSSSKFGANLLASLLLYSLIDSENEESLNDNDQEVEDISNKIYKGKILNINFRNITFKVFPSDKVIMINRKKIESISTPWLRGEEGAIERKEITKYFQHLGKSTTEKFIDDANTQSSVNNISEKNINQINNRSKINVKKNPIDKYINPLKESKLRIIIGSGISNIKLNNKYNNSNSNHLSTFSLGIEYPLTNTLIGMTYLKRGAQNLSSWDLMDYDIIDYNYLCFHLLFHTVSFGEQTKLFVGFQNGILLNGSYENSFNYDMDIERMERKDFNNDIGILAVINYNIKGYKILRGIKISYFMGMRDVKKDLTTDDNWKNNSIDLSIIFSSSS